MPHDDRKDWATSLASTKALVSNESSTAYSDFFKKWVRVIRVGKAITSDYKTISDALSHSQRGDRIEVESGNYYESVAIPHSVELTTADIGEEALISTRGPCITIATDEPVLISRITVVGRGQRQADSVAILIVRGSPVIKDCLLSAVHVSSLATPLVTHCTIENSESGCGLRLTDHCGGEYSFNEIRFHRNECVKIACHGTPLFKQNRIYQKRPLMAVVTIAGGRYGANCAPILLDNLISGSEHMSLNTHTNLVPGAEAALFDRPTNLLERNFSVPDGLIAVSWNASPTLKRNTLVHGAVGVHLAECFLPDGQFEENRILHCTSWGVYLGRNAAAMCHNNEISNNAGGVRSHAPNSVVLDCAISHNTFYGVMVVDAAPTFEHNTIDGSECGAIFLRNCTGMKFEGNTLRQNTICAIEAVRQCQCRLERNFIINNTNAGVLISDNSEVELDGNTIKENDTNVLVRGQSTLHMIRNTICKALGHGVLFMEQSTGVMEHNDVSESPSMALVAVVQRSYPEIRGNFIRAGASSGILVEGHATPYIHGNQISSLRDGIRVRDRGDPVCEENDIQSCTNGLLVEDHGLSLFVRNVLRTCSHAFVTCRTGGYPTVRANDCRSSATFGFAIEEGGLGEFEKNDVRDCGTGLCSVSGPSADARIIRNHFTGSSGFGIVVDHFAKALITRNVVNMVKTFAIGSAEDGQPTCYNNHVVSSDGSGIQCKRGGGIFHDNVIEGCSIAGVSIKAGSTAAFKKNLFSNNGGDGVHISKGARSVFEDDTVEANEGSGVVVDGDAHDTELRRVIIKKNTMHGVKVITSGSCTVTECTVSDNGGDGVYLANAGDAIIQNCTILRHGRGVVCREGGQAMLEGCELSDTTSDSIVYVLQKGSMTISKCNVRDGLRSGIKLASGGTLFLKDTIIRQCQYAAVECHADTSLNANDCQFEECKNGVVFAARTSVVEARDTAKTIYASAAQEASTAMRRKSTRMMKRGTSFVLSPTSSGLQPPTQERGLLTRSPSNAALSRIASSVTVVVRDDEFGTVSPAEESITTLPGHVRSCTFFNIKEYAILALGGSRGIVSDSRVNYCSTSIFYETHAGVVCRAVTCTKSHHQGILVEGTPCDSAGIVECVVKQSIGLGAVLRGVQASFTLTGCIFEENTLGGIVMIDTSCELLRCVVRHHETFGAWFASNADAYLRDCTFDTNKENNIVLVGTCAPTLDHCTIKNAEHGCAILQGASIVVRDCTVIMNRIAIAVYETIETLDQPAPLADTEWNERYRSGALRRRSSVGASLKAFSQSGTLQRHGSIVTMDSLSASPVPPSYNTASLVSPPLGRSGFPPTRMGGSDAIPSLAPTPQPTSSLMPDFPLVSSPSSPMADILLERSSIEHNSVGVDIKNSKVPVRIIGCRIASCMTHGAALHAGAIVVVDQCSLQSCGSAVVCHADALGTIRDTEFSLNRVGVYFNGNSRSRVTACNFVDNTDTGILAIDQVISAVVEKNNFRRNARCGVDVAGRSILTVGRNTFEEENIGVRSRDRSTPVISGNTFKDCQVGIESTGLRSKPRVLFNVFQNNRIAVCIDDKGEGDIARNVFRGSKVASIEVNHHGDPTVVQNLFEDHTEREAVGVRIGTNGAGVIGNNKFVQNSYGLRAGCNSESLVVMLNSFEQQTFAAVQFTEAAAGCLTRNQFFRNPRIDIQVNGGPSLAGLTVERNGLVVSGTGVVIEGRSVNPCVVRENRFFGSTGIGISSSAHGMAVMSHNLLHCLDVGIQFGAAGSGTLSGSLVAGCRVGVLALPGSRGGIEDSTILANSSHGIQTEEEAVLSVASSRIGFGAPQKPLGLFKGRGEVSSSYFFNAHMGIQLLENSATLIQKCAIQGTKIGAMFMPGPAASNVKGNAIFRNEIGVCITSQAKGFLQENSIFTNGKFALQATMPHAVLISKNYLSQDNEMLPSISGLTPAEISAVAKGNNAVGHGGRTDGSEKHLVPPTVSRPVPRDDVLLTQFHRYLNELAVPPTDSTSAVSEKSVKGDGSSSGFSYMALLASASQQKPPTHVLQAEERILDVMNRLDGSGIYKVAASKDDTSLKRLAKVSWDVGKTLSSRNAEQSYSWDSYYGGADDSDDEEDISDTSSGSDDGGRGVRRAGRAQRRVTRSTISKTRRRAKGTKTTPGRGGASSITPTSTPQVSALEVAKKSKEAQDALLEEMRSQQESEIAQRKLSMGEDESYGSSAPATTFVEGDGEDFDEEVDSPRTPSGISKRRRSKVQTWDAVSLSGSSQDDRTSPVSPFKKPPSTKSSSAASPVSDSSRSLRRSSTSAPLHIQSPTSLRRQGSIAAKKKSPTNSDTLVKSQRSFARSASIRVPVTLAKTNGKSAPLPSILTAAELPPSADQQQRSPLGEALNVTSPSEAPLGAVKKGSKPPPKNGKRGGAPVVGKKSVSPTKLSKVEPPKVTAEVTTTDDALDASTVAAANRLFSCKGVWIVMKDDNVLGSSVRETTSITPGTISDMLQGAAYVPPPDMTDGTNSPRKSGAASFLDDLRVPIVATTTSGEVLSASRISELANQENSQIEAVIIISDDNVHTVLGRDEIDGAGGSSTNRRHKSEGSPLHPITGEATPLWNRSSGGDDDDPFSVSRMTPLVANLTPPQSDPLSDIQLLVQRRIRLNSLWHQGRTAEDRDSQDMLEGRNVQLHAFFKLLARGSRLVLDLDDLQSGDENDSSSAPANRRRSLRSKSVYSLVNSLRSRKASTALDSIPSPGGAPDSASLGDGYLAVSTRSPYARSLTLGDPQRQFDDDGAQPMDASILVVPPDPEQLGHEDSPHDTIPGALPPAMEVRRRLRALHRQPGNEWLSTIQQSRGDIMTMIHDQERSFREEKLVKSMLDEATPPAPSAPLPLCEVDLVSVQERTPQSVARPGSGSSIAGAGFLFSRGQQFPARLSLMGGDGDVHEVMPPTVLPPCETPTRPRTDPRNGTGGRRPMRGGGHLLSTSTPIAIPISEGVYHKTMRKAPPPLSIGSGAPTSPLEQRVDPPTSTSLGIPTSPAPPKVLLLPSPSQHPTAAASVRVGSGNPFWSLPTTSRSKLPPSTPTPRPLLATLPSPRGKQLASSTALDAVSPQQQHQQEKFDIMRPQATSPFVRIGFTPLPHGALNMSAATSR